MVTTRPSTVLYTVYSTCLFCYASLRTNKVIEHFPIGRRLAFDAAMGRLWVVCAHCGRWNLTPLEERWEAIEDCERHFRRSRIRVSTDNVGLTRLTEGLTLIRIGQSLRPEFATWRYARTFARRYRRGIVTGGGAALLLGAGTVAGFSAGVLSGGMLLFALPVAWPLIQEARGWGTVTRVRRKNGQYARVTRRNVREARLVPEPHGRWRLHMPYEYGALHVDGEPAVELLRKVLPWLNTGGASPSTVRYAVDRLTVYSSGSDFLQALSKRSHFADRWAAAQPPPDPETADVELFPELPGSLGWLDRVDRMALEMAVNEDVERSALEGELASLTAAWREAEEIAAIADNLFLPASVEAWMRQHGRQSR